MGEKLTLTVRMTAAEATIAVMGAQISALQQLVTELTARPQTAAPTATPVATQAPAQAPQATRPGRELVNGKWVSNKQVRLLVELTEFTDFESGWAQVRAGFDANAKLDEWKQLFKPWKIDCQGCGKGHDKAKDVHDCFNSRTAA